MATYYVDPVSGSDANDGLSFANAWATTQKAADTATAGDEVRLCATGVETLTAPVDFDTQTGTDTNPIRFIAYNATGTAALTSGHYTIRAGGGIFAEVLDFSAALNTANACRFQRIEIDGNNNATLGLNMQSSAGCGAFSRFVACKIHGATSHGAIMRSSSIRFYECEVYGNGGDGLKAQTGAASRWANGHVFACQIHDNGGNGISFSDGGGVAEQCEVYDNGGDGIAWIGTGDVSGVVTRNTIFGNTGDGLSLGATVPVGRATHNTFTSNGGYGVNANANPISGAIYQDYNHYHGNTSGHHSSVLDANINDGTVGSNNQTGDPQFADTTDGSEDFTPANGSPLDGNGFNGGDIGARAAADPAGGGGTRAYAL